MRGIFHSLIRAALLSACLAAPVAGQSLFEPVAKVGDSAVTRWEVDQRTRFLTLFNTPGDIQALALERLIDERLQLLAAREAGIEIPEEALIAGMEEFAGRANLPLDEFIAAIGQGGVSEEAFRDFVRAGIAWRELVRARFIDQARPADAEIDRRLIETGSEAGERVLLYEIVLPGETPETYAASRVRAAEIARIDDPDAFQAAARRFSAAPNAWRGGEIDWRVLDSIPDALRGAISRLRPGQTSAPVFLDESIIVYHMRDREALPAAAAGDTQVEYATVVFASATAAAEARGRVQGCNDLYGFATQEAVSRDTVATSALPATLRDAVSALDIGETAVLPGNPAGIVMLCDRRLDTPFAANREAVLNELANRNLTRLATRFLAEERARTPITVFE